MEKIIVNALKQPIYHIPYDIIKYRQELGIGELNLWLMVVYLINQRIPIPYDPKKIGQEISMNHHEVLQVIHNAQEANLIKINIKETNSKKQEYIDITPLYDKLASLYQTNHQQANEQDLFAIFEKEFGRPLSPMEYEIINSWLNNKMDRELIIGALKEAIFNGVTNLRYIDKILYEWNKAGFKKITDIKKKKPEIKKEELFDYNWLEE